MKRSDTFGARGSFSVWGSGFHYDYDHNESRLHVSDQNRIKDYARLQLDRHASHDAHGYVRYLDRANMIKAMVLSNNTTLNLAETMNHYKVSAILNSTARTSYYAHCLSLGNFTLFSAEFSKDTHIQHLNIKKFSSRNCLNEFYVGRIQTLDNKSLSVRACTLAGLMPALSESIINELVTIEYSGHSNRHHAYALLNVSSKLTSLSMILDEHYRPEKKLYELSDIEDGRLL